jgi:hypothetical protein
MEKSPTTAVVWHACAGRDTINARAARADFVQQHMPAYLELVAMHKQSVAKLSAVQGDGPERAELLREIEMYKQAADTMKGLVFQP